METVIGPPGCGKTTYLTGRVRDTWDAGDTPAVVSLTRTAARTASGRVGLARELVGTLHSFAYRALNSPPLAETPDGLKLWAEDNPNLPLSADRDIDGDNGAAMARASDADRALQEYQAARARKQQPTGIAADFGVVWEKWKAERGLSDFTDLIAACIESVSSAPEHPHALFVDEAQDLSPLEVELILKWGESAGQTIVVGDPYQCLYDWRGSDPRVVFAGTPDEVLSQSYRVPHAVHARALAWFKRSPEWTDIQYRPTNVEGNVRQSIATWTHPDIDSVERDVNEGKSVMILTSTDYMTEPIVRAMRERGLLFHNPYRRRHGGWNPIRQTDGVSTMDRIRAFLTLAQDGRYPTAEELVLWTELLPAKLALNKGIRRKDVSTIQEGEDGIDVGQVLELLTEETLHAWHDGNVGWLTEHLLAAYRRAGTYIGAIIQKRGLDAVNETPQITIGTIHSVKGGEADSVHLAPDISPAAYKAAQVDTRAMFRTFYVGLTRARESLTLWSPTSKMAVRL